MIVNDGGGYGGTSSPGGLCTPSNGDLAAQVNSLFTRVAVLEQLVSALLGTDITTVQLSDISQDLGNVLGGTFGGGLLADLQMAFMRLSPWGWTGVSLPFEGGQNAAGGRELTMINTLHRFLGIFSGQQFTYQTNASLDLLAGGALDNAIIGGFYYEARMSPRRSDVADTPIPPCRIAVGMAAPNWGGSEPDYLWGINDEEADRDEGTGIYTIFQYSQPRGDADWKFVTRSETNTGMQQTIVPTGMPVMLNHIYDFKMRVEPGSPAVFWEIIDQSTGAQTSGSAAFSTSHFEPLGDVTQYSAGVGMWNSIVQSSATPGMWIHHAYCQPLKLSNVGV